MKKVVENSIDLKTRHSNHQNNKYYIQIEKSIIDTTFKKATSTFINNIDNLLAKEDIALSSMYKNIGKLELILEITNDEYIEKLKSSGEMLVSEYLDKLIEEN